MVIMWPLSHMPIPFPCYASQSEDNSDCYQKIYSLVLILVRPSFEDKMPYELIEGNVGESYVLLPCEILNRGDNFLHWYKDGQPITYNETS